MTLQEQISRIGTRMVACMQKCHGIKNEPHEGVLPRCLSLESRDSKERGVVVVGLNPGNAGKPECEYYQSTDLSYGAIVNYWEQSLKESNEYYKRLRELANQLGLGGTILWTELAKCENDSNVKRPPVQTLRTCANLYLLNELKLVPNDWPLIAAGRDAFNALVYICPSRAVIGIPHPTGSFGDYPRLFEHGKLRARYCDMIQSTWESTPPLAVWIKTSKE